MFMQMIAKALSGLADGLGALGEPAEYAPGRRPLTPPETKAKARRRAASRVARRSRRINRMRAKR